MFLPLALDKQRNDLSGASRDVTVSRLAGSAEARCPLKTRRAGSLRAFAALAQDQESGRSSSEARGREKLEPLAEPGRRSMSSDDVEIDEVVSIFEVPDDALERAAGLTERPSPDLEFLHFQLG